MNLTSLPRRNILNCSNYHEKKCVIHRAFLYLFLFQGDNAFFTYQLDDPSRAFNIDARTGWLTVRDQAMLDRERQPVLNMRVLAKEKVPSVVRGASNR